MAEGVTKVYEYKNNPLSYTTGDEIHFSCEKGSKLEGSDVVKMRGKYQGDLADGMDGPPFAPVSNFLCIIYLFL